MSTPAETRTWVTRIGYPERGGGPLQSLHKPMPEPEPLPETETEPEPEAETMTPEPDSIFGISLDEPVEHWTEIQLKPELEAEPVQADWLGRNAALVAGPGKVHMSVGSLAPAAEAEAAEPEAEL